MKTIAKLFCGVALTSMMASCSSDEPKAPTASDGNFYSTITLQFESRSETTTPGINTNSSDGYEIGLDAENKVQSLKVILATYENNAYKFLTMATGTPTASGNGAGDHSNHISYKLQFKSSDLVDRAGEKVYVFAFANAPESLTAADLQAALSTGTMTLTSEDDNGIWTANQFFMSNQQIAEKTLPAAADITTYTEANPFELGTVEIERLACRFDFKSTGDDSYTITEVGSTEPKAKVTLTGMALVNIAKEFYLLPHVSADGLIANSTLCGLETPTNWVVSPNETYKQTTSQWTNAANYYFAPTGAATDGFDFTTLEYMPIGTITGNATGGNWYDPAGTQQTNDYKIWRYATENTLPGISYQKHGVTTSVYFKANLTAAPSNTALATAMENGNVLYALNGVLYGDKAAVEAYVTANPVSSLAEEWAKAAIATNIDANGDLLGHGDSMITIYRPEGTAGAYTYPMYYCYYNRHNNNGKNNEMGIMEFATVRNNIYKLSVSQIYHYGHPGKPGDDPTPEDPDDPDENPETWFVVDVHVLPWVVRVNDIQF